MFWNLFIESRPKAVAVSEQFGVIAIDQSLAWHAGRQNQPTELVEPNPIARLHEDIENSSRSPTKDGQVCFWTVLPANPK